MHALIHMYIHIYIIYTDLPIYIYNLGIFKNHKIWKSGNPNILKSCMFVGRHVLYILLQSLFITLYNM